MPWAEGTVARSFEPQADALDAMAVAYLALPLGIFLIGWLELWAALPLCFCLLYALRPLLAAARGRGVRRRLQGWRGVLAIAVGCGWTLFGGTGHWMFANADWHIRDAVLHDLVVGAWPVGYGMEAGGATLLRAPIGYYLPAAFVGKAAGLPAAHVALAVWTAAGVALLAELPASEIEPYIEAQRATLQARLIEAGYGNVNINESVDTDLLGGLVVRIGARLYDTSLKSRLQRLQYAMKGAA